MVKRSAPQERFCNAENQYSPGSSMWTSSSEALHVRCAHLLGVGTFQVPQRGAESVGRASRPSFLFHALTGETPIPLSGNPPNLEEITARPTFGENGLARSSPKFSQHQLAYSPVGSQQVWPHASASGSIASQRNWSSTSNSILKTARSSSVTPLVLEVSTISVTRMGSQTG